MSTSAIVYIRKSPYLCTEILFIQKSNYNYAVGFLKSILIAGGVYCLANASKDKEIKELEGQIASHEAQDADWEYKYNQLKNQVEGELEGRLKCYMIVNMSYGSMRYESEPNWHTGYLLKIKNEGTTKINIDSLRVFWTCEGRRSTWSPWTTAPYTIKPGQEISIRLYGAFNRWHFGTKADILAINSLLAGKGTDKDAMYKNVLPITCDAQFIISSDQKLYVQQLKNFPGQLIGFRNQNIYSPWKITNGTDVKAINDQVNPPKDDEE